MDNPVCSPACPKGTLCASTEPRQCVRAVCKPECKGCEVCDDGVCVPGVVRYVSAYPPVLVGVGKPNASDGGLFWRPQLRAFPESAAGNGSGVRLMVVQARTGGDANVSRFLGSDDGNGELWTETEWNQSSLSDDLPGTSPVCFPWGSSGHGLCADRQLHRQPSYMAQNARKFAPLLEETMAFAPAGSFKLDLNQSVKSSAREVKLIDSNRVSFNLSVHNITAGAAHLVNGRSVQLLDARMLGSPATADRNGTLIQLLSVAWDLPFGSCLHVQNELCLQARRKEQMSSAKAGDCARCLADHMIELVRAGCNDSDSSLFCSNPGPPYPGKAHLAAVSSTDEGQSWSFRSQIPPWIGYSPSAPNDGWPLGMASDPADEVWTCGLRPLSADVVVVQTESNEGGPALLFAVWQPEELQRSPDPGSRSAQAPMCGARSTDIGMSWVPTNHLHVRRTSATDGSNQQAPPFPAGGPVGLTNLGNLGGVAMSDGNCGQGHSASGRPGAGLWLWTASTVGLAAIQNATPSLQGTNLASFHNAHVKSSGKRNENSFTPQFINGTDHRDQSSGYTDVQLLRSNKTHAELLVVYDRLPDMRGGHRWNGTQTQVWAMRLVISSSSTPVLPCHPKCKAKQICVHEGAPHPWGQEGRCVAEKSCTKPKCKFPQTCDKRMGHCITPPPPPAQSCQNPMSADITHIGMNETGLNARLVAVWQPHTPSKPYKSSMCRASSYDGGRSWNFQGTVDEGKNFFSPSTVHSYGILPRTGYAPTSAVAGLMFMTQGRSSALGAGLALWASKVSVESLSTKFRNNTLHSSSSHTSISFADNYFNLAAMHNDALTSITDTQRSFTTGFVKGDVDPDEAGFGTDVQVISSNATNVEMIVLYSKSKGLFLPDWHSHIGFPAKVEQNETILFSMRIRVSTLAPPLAKNVSQLEYITWYDSYPEEQQELTKPGPNLIWASGDPAALEAKASALGVKAMWAFNEYCANPYRIFDAPYCGNDRVHCIPNATAACPFGKACPQPPSKQCKLPPKKGQDHWLCECPYPPAQLALNWTQHVVNVAELIRNKSRIVGLWMGDEPEIGGMSSDSLCAVAATMKQALQRVGRPDVWIMYNDGPDSARFREGLCKGLDYFSIDSYDAGASEANEVAALYKRDLVPKLRAPNKWERRGQGLWFVPGLYAACSGPVVPTPRYPFGNQSLNRSEPTCKGGRLRKTPSDLMAKMAAFWKHTKEMPHIKGINPWHWQDRPTMSPAEFRRGAKSLGPELLQLMSEISTYVHNISS